ncbi:MAG: SpaA isopeptide-forming pilin-related protein [Clostridia bacterium]|nr:SpaA isopeptide-forming pilin-related protein [Clostridia bacterium]
MKKVRKSILSILLLIFLATSLALSSSAANISENENLYINIMQGAVKNSNYGVNALKEADFYRYNHSGKNTSMRMLYVSKDDKGTPNADNSGDRNYAYCIQSAAKTSSYIIQKATKYDKDEYFNSFSEIQKKGILAAINLGYPNSTLGVKACDAYVATQIIVWEIQNGYRNPMTNTVTNNLYQKSTINGTPAKKAYDLLGKQIQNFYLLPSFANTELKLKYNINTQKYEGVFEDKNNVIKDYLIEKNPKLEIKIEKNKLFISSKEKCNDNIKILRKHLSNRSQKPMIVFKDSSQKIMVGSADIFSESSFNIKSEYGFDLQKTGNKISSFEKTEFDGKEKIKFNFSTVNLANVEFELLDTNGKLIKTAKTDEKGRIKFENLYRGTFYLREVEAPKGYLKDENLHKIVIEDNWKTVNINNEKAPFEFFIQKELEENDSDYSNIIFGIYAAEDIKIGDDILKKDALIESFKVDENGQIQGKIVLPCGRYYIAENQTKNGYKIDETKHFFDSKDEKLYLKIKNSKIPVEEIPDDEVPKIFIKKESPKTGIEMTEFSNRDNLILFISIIVLMSGILKDIRLSAK